jgi:hypothetical protein
MMKIKRPKNRIFSLLLSGVLLGVGVGVPAQIIGSSSASAAGYPAELAITRASVPGASGAAFTTQPEFEVRDSSGNAVTGTAYVIDAWGTEGGAPQPAFLGTTTVTTGLDGKATFPSDFGISGNVNTPIKIIYRISSVVLYATETITLNTPGAASKLIVTRLSIGPASGSVFATQPQVTVMDAWNNNVGGIRTITAAGETLVGTQSATTDAVTGIATFPADFGISGVAGTVQTITYSTTGGVITSATQKVTIGSPSTAPEAPQLSAIGLIGGASVSFWGIAPAAGGSAITGYEYQIIGLRSWSSVSNLSASNGLLLFTIDTSDLLRQSGFTYFQFRAINSSSAGPSNGNTDLGVGGVGLGRLLGSQPSSSGLIMSGEILTNRITFSGSPISYTYRWFSCTLSLCSEIPGATSSTYLLTDAEVGKYMQNRVTATYSIGTLPEVASTTISQVVLASSGPDTTSPTVTSVTSTTNNGSYKAGDQISIRVNFSESVAVTGTPKLTLESGSTDRAVNYASGTGTNQLTFTYTVQAGDTAADLDYLSTSALDLNGGTIKDAAGNNAILTLAAPGASNSLGANKAIVIDTTAPTVTLAATSSTSGSATITFTVTGNEPITCSTLSSTHGDDFNFTGTGVSTITGIVQTSGTVCTITATSSATNGGGAVTSTLTAASTFSMTDTAGNAQTALTGSPQSTAVTIDTTAPTVTLAATAATSGSGTVTFTVTGNEPIACSTLSTTSGTDFTFTGITSISGIAQTSPTVCTITVVSTATLVGETATATIAAASSFSITDTTGNAQTILTDSPQSTSITVTDTTAPVLTLTSASALTSISANINFTSDEVGIYYYLIYAAADGPPDAATIFAQGTAIAKGTSSALAAANTANATGLSPNTAYKAYVVVKDAATNSSAVSTIAFTTLAIVPGTPGAPTAVAGNGQATVTVAAPTTGGTPTSYTVTSSPGGATCTVTGASGSCTVTGLTNGTPYTFTSRASNTGGPSVSASVASNEVTPFAPAPVFFPEPAPAPVCDAACVAAQNAAAAKVVADRIAAEAKVVSDAAAKVVADKVVVDKTAAEAAAKTAVEKATAAVVAKAAADAAAVQAATIAKAAADAQAAAVDAANKAAAALKSATTTAAAKAAATATAAKAATTAANAVKAAATAAKAAATARATATNASKQVDIAIGALGSKTAAAATAAQANAIAAAAKAAANAAAKAATDQAAAAKVASNNANTEARIAAERIATEQKQAADAAAEAKVASDAALKATEEKIAAATDAQKAAEAVVKALEEKIALAEASVKAKDVTERAAIDKKIEEVTAKVAEAQRVADAANTRAATTAAAQETAQAAATTAAQNAATRAAEVVAVRTESIAKTAVATKAAADAGLAAKIATAAVAAAAKVPSRAVISAKPSSTTGKNSAKATISGLKPGQKVKVTVNVKGK